MTIAYSGNPANFPEAVNIPDGSSAPSSALFQTAYEGELDRTAALAAAAAQDWHGAWLWNTVGGGGGAQFAGAWDPTLGQWMTVGVQGGPSADYLLFTLGQDDGNTTYWTSIVGSHTGMLAAACCADPTTPGRYWRAAILGSTAIYVEYTPTTGGGYTAGFSITGTTNLQSVEMKPFLGYIVVAVGVSSGTGNCILYSVQASSPGSSPSQQPAGESVGFWRLATDGATTLLAVPWAEPTSSAANYWTTTDGHTWTSVALSTTLLLASTDSLLGICWSPVRQAFFALVQRAGNIPQVYSSPNGTTWTAVTMVTTSTTLGAKACDLAAIGQNLVATLSDSGGTGSRLVFSPDGGATWYNTPASFGSSEATSTPGYIYPRLIQGDNSLLAINNLVGRFSRAFGRVPSVRL